MSINWFSLICNERRIEGGVKYGEVAEDWQLAIDQALLTHDRCYMEMPRGHDKSGRLACHALCWLLEGEHRMGYAAGVDKDNARLFRDEMKKQRDRSPHIFGDIEFYRDRIENNRRNNVLEILSSDAPSSVGLKFNLLLINDFVDWQNQEYFEILLSATGKIPGVKVWIESNAGRMKKGYKWDVREHARTSGAWFFKTTKKWLASWTPKAWFKEMTAILSLAAYRRLIGNEWIEEADAFLTLEQVQAITKDDLRAAVQRPDDIDLVATSTDLGISKDATAVASLGLSADNKPVRLLDLTVFPGSKVNPVQIVDVEDEIDRQISRFASEAVIVDPWNLRKTIQERAGDWPIEEFTFSPAHLMQLTQNVFRHVVGRQIEIYPNAGSAPQSKESWNLQRELVTAIIRQMSYGERIDHRKSGYTDRVIAVGMALWWLGQNSFPKDQREFKVHVV